MGRGAKAALMLAISVFSGISLGSEATRAEVDIRVLGNVQSTLQSKEIERPFFEKILSERSQGRFNVQFRTMDETGIKGFEAVRLLKMGVFDVMAMQLGYISGDVPFVLGLDLPGLAPTIEKERKFVDVYRASVAEILEKEYNGKLLALWPYPGQAFFCREEIKGLSGLRGLKVRVHNASVANLVKELGGSAVSLSFPEVYQALQRGVVDCAITGTLPGNTAHWYEVSDYLYPLYVGWSIQAHIANLDFWNKLSEADRQQLVELFAEFEEENWQAVAAYTEDGVNCNTGQGECRNGTVQKMKLVPVSDEDRALMQSTARAAVVPAWKQECEAKFAGCGEKWDETIGRIVAD